PIAEERQRLGVLLRSVVRVINVSDAPDYDQPWQTHGPEQSNGSGAIVETARGLRVLTNAHCVQDCVYAEVRRYGNARKYPAEVAAIGHECDLALLKVEDASFFEQVSPLQVGALPHLSDSVSVCGYPIGGDRLSITKGIVSRIDLVRYAQSQRRLLALQIDAAINSGNSGGPVFQNDQLVGVAFQSLDDAESVGYVIAAPVIEHFLKDVEDGVYDGFPGLGVVTQKLESEAHRRSLGLRSQGRGVLITGVTYDSSAWGVLQEGDVILAVDGVEVASSGTVKLREGEIIDHSYVVSHRHVGESASLQVFRDGKLLDCVVPMKAPNYLVAEDRFDVKPTYFVYGGLLFVPLTRDYLKTWGDQWWQHAPHDLMHLYEYGVVSPELKEVVVLQKVLADRVNQGYHDMESVWIVAVNGVRVQSLAHLVEVVDGAEGDFVTFRASDGPVIVLDRAQVASRIDGILDRFGVPSDRSPDL
ncbi:MAG: serine protease, partial [Myxococcota bacterium]